MANPYVDTVISCHQMADLQRRINALEATMAEVYNRKWGSEGTGDGQFNAVADVCIYGGEVYVSDSILDRIQVFNLDGVFQRKWGSTGAGNGQFNQPSYLTVYGDEVYVSDQLNHRIQVFNLAGVFQRKWGVEGTGNGEFNGGPRGIGVDYTGDVFVADGYATSPELAVRIQVFHTDGTYERKFGSYGTGDGQFEIEGPYGLSIWSYALYVLDFGAHRVEVFDSAGVFSNEWGSQGTGDGQFQGPRYIATNGVDEMFVGGDSWTGNIDKVQVFDKDGTYLRSIGTYGSGDGELNANLGMAVYDDEVYVCDSNNHRVQVFAVRQTEWFGWNAGGKTSLGTPDGGVLVPADGSLFDYEWASNNIDEMRTAIEALVATGEFINPVTHDPYGWAEDEDNLLFWALANKDYGTPLYTFDWVPATLDGEDMTALDIGSIYECIVLLERVA